MIKRIFFLIALIGFLVFAFTYVSGDSIEPVRTIKSCINGDSLPEGKCVRLEDYDTPQEAEDAAEWLTGGGVDERFEFIDGDLGR